MNQLLKYNWEAYNYQFNMITNRKQVQVISKKQLKAKK